MSLPKVNSNVHLGIFLEIQITLTANKNDRKINRIRELSYLQSKNVMSLYKY